MAIYQRQIEWATAGKGLLEITDAINEELKRSKVTNGVVVVFCQHTSCSLVIMENADPTARRDLERWLDRLIPENDPHFEHTIEGPDDMPSHIKMALTRTSETIPVIDGELQLGTWQGVFLWEHRIRPHRRTLIITVMGD